MHALHLCAASLLVVACVVHATDYAIIPGKAKIAAIGDHGHAGPTAQAVSELVKSWTPLDAVIALGDVNYPRGSRWTIDENVGKYYSEFIYPYKGRYGKGAVGPNRFWPCPGNHDYGTQRKRDLSPYLDYMPVKKRRFYDVRIGPVHLFSLDSDKTQARLSANASGSHTSETEGSRPPHVPSKYTSHGPMSNISQALWLRRRLLMSNAPWKLVYFHHPPHSSGSHGSSVHMRWPFEEWGAVAVMSGHDHSYERIVKGQKGFPYFVNGMGGARTYGFQVQPKSGSVIRHTSRAGGAQLIEANATTITFKFFNTLEPHNPIDCYMAHLVPANTTASPPPAPPHPAPHPSPSHLTSTPRLSSRATLSTPPPLTMVIQYSTCDGQPLSAATSTSTATPSSTIKTTGLAPGPTSAPSQVVTMSEDREGLPTVAGGMGLGLTGAPAQSADEDIHGR